VIAATHSTPDAVVVRELFGEKPVPKGSPAAAAASMALHGAVIGIVAVLSLYQTVVAPQAKKAARLTFVTFEVPKAVAVRVETPVLRMEAPAAPTPAAVTLAAPVPEPEPVVQPRPAPEPDRVAAVPAPEPVPAAPRVQVGVFGEGPSASPAPEPARAVQNAGFDVASADTGNALATAKMGRVVSAGFDGGAGGPSGGTVRAASVSVGGFGTGAANGTTREAAGVVRASGFSETRPAAVRAAAAQSRPAARTPVEVLHKPSPGYTDEARQLKVEGEVVLEVEFTPEGRVQVLSVVRGLGHGLDEKAVVAATAIRFRPATSDGQAVASRANLTIVFRLA